MGIPLPLAAEIKAAAVKARLTGGEVVVLVPDEMIGLDLTGLKASPGKVILRAAPARKVIGRAA